VSATAVSANRKTQVILRSADMKVIFLLMLAAITAGAQTTTLKHPVTDVEKISDALRAGPDFITKDATLLDWPSTPGGEYRVLRQGSSEWTCLPGVPGYPHDEPGCFDREFMKWIKDSLAGRTPHIDRIGIAYMYTGAWVPDKSAKDPSAAKDFHVGPHVMIITPHQDEVQAFSRDGSNGMPYVAHLPNGTQLYLVMPYQQAAQ
jgi:hypothetical protein